MGESNGQKILVGIDGSPNADAALRWAVDEARQRGMGVEAVNVWQIPALAYSAPGYVPPTGVDVEREAHATLDRALEGVADDGVKVVLQSVEGLPAAAILKIAADPDVAMVVVGSQGHGGVIGFLLGSVSHALTHHCKKPLVVVPAGWDATVTLPDSRRIVVGIDGSEESCHALEWACADAAAKGVDVEAIHAWAVPSPVLPTHLTVKQMAAAGQLEKLESRLRDAASGVDTHGVDVKYSVIDGHPARVLTKAACDGQALVVGTRGLGHAHELVSGSVSHACTHHAQVPVIVVPRVEGSQR